MAIKDLLERCQNLTTHAEGSQPGSCLAKGPAMGLISVRRGCQFKLHNDRLGDLTFTVNEQGEVISTNGVLLRGDLGQGAKELTELVGQNQPSGRRR